MDTRMQAGGDAQLEPRAIHRMMCQHAKAIVELEHVDAGSEITVFRYKSPLNEDGRKSLQYFLDYWKKLFGEQLGAHTDASLDGEPRLVIAMPLEIVRDVTHNLLQNEKDRLQEKQQHVERLCAAIMDTHTTPTERAIGPLNKDEHIKRQIESDQQFAALLQWQDLHPGEKHASAITDTHPTPTERAIGPLNKDEHIKQQIKSDEQLAALLQWQDLHPGEKRASMTFNNNDLAKLKSEIEREPVKHRL